MKHNAVRQVAPAWRVC